MGAGPGAVYYGAPEPPFWGRGHPHFAPPHGPPYLPHPAGPQGIPWYGPQGAVRTRRSAVAVAEFESKLRQAVAQQADDREAPPPGVPYTPRLATLGRLPAHLAAELLPRDLSHYIHYSGMTVQKFVRDNAAQFAVVKDAEGWEWVQKVAKARPLQQGSLCDYWVPEEGRGCPRGSECIHRHSLPAELRQV